MWGTSNFLDEEGEPLDTKNFQPGVVKHFRTVGDVIIEGKVDEDKVRKLTSEKEKAQFKEILSVISCHLVKIKKTWIGITRSDHGPHHHGWSRLLVDR